MRTRREHFGLLIAAFLAGFAGDRVALAADSITVVPGMLLGPGGRIGGEVSLLADDRYLKLGWRGFEIASLGLVLGRDDRGPGDGHYVEAEAVISDILAPHGALYHIVTFGAGPRMRIDGRVSGAQATVSVATPPVPPALLLGRYVVEDGERRWEYALGLKWPVTFR